MQDKCQDKFSVTLPDLGRVFQLRKAGDSWNIDEVVYGEAEGYRLIPIPLHSFISLIPQHFQSAIADRMYRNSIPLNGGN